MNSFIRFLLYFFAPIIVLAVSQCLAFFMLDFAISKIDIEIVSVVAFVLCLAPCYPVWHTTAYLYDFNSYKYLGKKIVFSFGILLSIAICYLAKYFVYSDFALVCGWVASLFYCNMFFGSIFRHLPPEKHIDLIAQEFEEPKEQLPLKATPDQKLKAYKKIIAWLKEKAKENPVAILVLFFSISANSQVTNTRPENIWIAKEYSKEIALYNSKDFLFNNVLNIGSSPLRFEIIPLAAAGSGELTTLLYKSESDGKEGMILGFYGNYWNDQGISYLGYQFKNLDREKATDFLQKVQSAIEQHSKYLKSDSNNNNVVFRFDDMEVLIFDSSTGINIRIFWKSFDSTWEKTAFDRSKRRFEKSLK